MALKERIEGLLNNHKIVTNKLLHSIIEFIDAQGLEDDCIEHICTDFNVTEEVDEVDIEDDDSEVEEDFDEEGKG